MNKKNRIRIIGAVIIICLWLLLCVFAMLKAPDMYSETERRKLAIFPELSTETLLNGKFTNQFEDYTLDQFPFRDEMRQIKAIWSNYIMRQKDNNDIYIYNGYAAKMEYPLQETKVEKAIEYFQKIYTDYLKNTNVKTYVSFVPDKNYYMGEKSNHLSMDYTFIEEKIKNISWATYIPIMDLLSMENYYKTDTHWKQEDIVKVAQRLAKEMNTSIPEESEFEIHTQSKPFYGVYYGQAALPMKPEELKYLTSKYTEASKVLDYETNKVLTVYDLKATEKRDLYDTFVHGAKPLLEITNPIAENPDRELVIFRDSFASSLSPLLLKGYGKITLIDTRYMSPALLKRYIEFNDQDVLFMLSTLVLNKSEILKK